MERASRVMYSIANIFNWIMLILSVVGIVFAVLGITGIYTNQLGQTGYLVWCIVMFLTCLVLIFLTRIAKADRTSKFWDVLLMILGILSWDIFYFLGGLFGILAVRR